MKLLIVCLALLAAASASRINPYGASTVYHSLAPYPYVPAPVPAIAVYAKPDHIGGTEFRAQDTLGAYSFGYNSDNGIQKTEQREVDGSVSGSYGYTSPEGEQIAITYTAGEQGFVASGPAIPRPVEPTAEVVEATRQHEQATKEMEAKIAAAPKPVDTVPIPYAHPYGYTVPYSYARPIAYAYKPLPVVTYTNPLTNYRYSYSHSQ